MRTILAAALASALLAGCAAPGAEMDAAGAPMAGEHVSAPLAARGSTTVYACAYVVTSECRVLVQGDDEVPLAAPGRLERLEATVSYTEEAPADMWVWLVAARADGYDREEPLEEEMGTPPLTLSWDLSAHQGTDLALIVYSMTYRGAVVVAGGVAPPLDFAIEGEILHRAP